MRWDVQTAARAAVLGVALLAGCSLAAKTADKCKTDTECAAAFGAGAVCGGDGYCRKPSADAGGPDADAESTDGPLTCTAPALDGGVTPRPCTDPAASRCADGECTACGGDTDCSHLTGNPRCVEGKCVECTTATEGDDCGTKACRPDSTCGAADRGDLEVCQGCEADSECEADHRCVPVQFMGTSQGTMCLKTQASGCAQPFGLVPFSVESVSGAPSEAYCGFDQARTTCDALAAYNTACEADEDCATSGAKCVGTAPNQRCTYACANAFQCEEGLDCDSGFCVP